jgi:hypothetical protein
MGGPSGNGHSWHLFLPSLQGPPLHDGSSNGRCLLVRVDNGFVEGRVNKLPLASRGGYRDHEVDERGESLSCAFQGLLNGCICEYTP